MEERKVFCARWLFCEALAQEAVAVVVVVVVCVELVVEVVLKSDFCAGCFPVCGMCRGGGRRWDGIRKDFWVALEDISPTISTRAGLGPAENGSTTPGCLTTTRLTNTNTAVHF